MNTKSSPTRLTIRSYQVGFGDCFLLSFGYGGKSEKHVLMDFGSTGLPDGIPTTRMLDVAKDIAKRTNGKLHAVVATHRHKDHISGFETRAGKGPGDVIAALKPDLVVQPWTEDPQLATNATGPRAARTRGGSHVAALTSMNLTAEHVFRLSQNGSLPKALSEQLSFLGENNISNVKAVENLMRMGKNVYVNCGSPSGLEEVLPGVRAHVLGPPTVDQTDTIKKQRSKDKDEFWHFQANLFGAAAAVAGRADARTSQSLFPGHVKCKGANFPIDDRWLIYHARRVQGDQMLGIVTMLDKAMNNTSVILVLEVGKTRLLFPGDAQIENWAFALSKDKYRKLLADVTLYKVGHHGSLNATPKSLWKLFTNRSKKMSSRRLVSIISTMAHKHGTEEKNTEVPRRTLVSALKSETTLHSTQDIEAKDLYFETVVNFA